MSPKSALATIIKVIPPYLPTLLILGTICYISLNANPLPDDTRWLLFKGADKLIHFIMYIALTGTFCFDYYRRDSHRHALPTLIWALLAAILIGGILEIMQWQMALGREGDYIDFIANTLGAITGIIAGHRIFAHSTHTKVP